MMYYDDDEYRVRKQIKQRYNRRFFLGAHVVVFLVSLGVPWIAPELRQLTVIALLTLIPHAIYVAYAEYRYWLAHKVEREMYRTSYKQKRYPQDDLEPETFRLTDDGEIEAVRPAKRRRSENSRGWDTDMVEEEERRVERKRRKPEKRRRKYDTDEFDVKKLLKKLKDIVD